MFDYKACRGFPGKLGKLVMSQLHSHRGYTNTGRADGGRGLLRHVRVEQSEQTGGL